MNQALPAKDLLNAQLNAGASFSPVIDGVELSAHPMALAAAGNFSNPVSAHHAPPPHYRSHLGLHACSLCVSEMLPFVISSRCSHG